VQQRHDNFVLAHFLLDSRNENLPEKRIHRNYALTTVSMPRFLRPASAREDCLAQAA